MKDLKAFLEAMATDKELEEKVRGAKDVKEIVEVAKEAGYAVTEEEINDFMMEAVAGGKVTLEQGLDYTVTGVALLGGILGLAGELSGKQGLKKAGDITQTVAKVGGSYLGQLGLSNKQ